MRAELERIDLTEHGSLRWDRTARPAPPGFPFVWHHHPEVELTLILRGHGQRFVGDSIEPFGPGDLVLLGPHLPHTWHTPPGGGSVAEAVVVQFLPDFAGHAWWDLPEATALRRLLTRAARGVAFPPDHDGVARTLIAMETRNPWQRITDLLDVLGRLADPADADGDAGRVLSAAPHAAAPRHHDRRRIDTVCRLIAEHYHEPMTQARAASAVGLGPSSFSRFFKRMTGRTFVNYLHEVRIADACRRLTHTDRPITDVCFDCGFENLSHFNRIFRRLRGTSPRAFRRAARAPSGAGPTAGLPDGPTLGADGAESAQATG